MPDKANRLPYYLSADFTPHWISEDSIRNSSIHTIPPFRFTDQLGDTITEKSVEGKIYVVDFFFTACPGICKRLTTHLGLVQSALRNNRDVLILSHSVTPETDTGMVLQRYAKLYGVNPAQWHLLTGDRKEMYTLARKAYFADEDMGEQKNTNDFLHTENMMLVDREKHIRGVYKGTSLKDIQDLIADIKLLEKEK